MTKVRNTLRQVKQNKEKKRYGFSVVSKGEELRFEMPAGMIDHLDDVRDFQEALNEER